MVRRGRRPANGDKVAELIAQAQRARRMAADCGSSMIAELFEVHADMCERNARLFHKPELRLVGK